MSLVEILVAAAVFAVVLGIAYGAIVGSLRVQADQEAVTTTQAKLRRIVEVITQDLRSAVFGSITDGPYASGARQVSFMLLSGGAGYTVLPHDQGQGFQNATNLEILAASASHLAGKEVVMINPQGTGVILQITHVTPGSRSSSLKLHSSCKNTIPYKPGMLLFEIETMGLRYDQTTERIQLETGAGGGEVPYAFGVSDFRIDYVYTSSTAPEPTVVRSSPHRSGGQPTRSYRDDGHTYTLSRLQVVVEGEAVSRGRTIARTYSAQVELSGTESFTLKELVACTGTGSKKP